MMANYNMIQPGTLQDKNVGMPVQNSEKQNIGIPDADQNYDDVNVNPETEAFFDNIENSYSLEKQKDIYDAIDSAHEWVDSCLKYNTTRDFVKSLDKKELYGMKNKLDTLEDIKFEEKTTPESTFLKRLTNEVYSQILFKEKEDFVIDFILNYEQFTNGNGRVVPQALGYVQDVLKDAVELGYGDVALEYPVRQNKKTSLKSMLDSVEKSIKIANFASKNR